MKECSKSMNRRLSDSRFVRKYFVGEGIDIGGKPDPLAIYREFFPLMKCIRTWDLEDGDAQFLGEVSDHNYEFVHSSHCLEHLHDPIEGLKNWLRVLKDDGYLIITIPDEDLYEQGVFPSTFNLDHRWTFTLYKSTSWSDRSINVLDMVKELGSAAAVEKVELLDANYRYQLPRYDQTLTPVAECGIEMIIRKRSQAEIARKGLRMFHGQPDREIKIHLNQHRDDLKTLKSSNAGTPPFTNDSDI